MSIVMDSPVHGRFVTGYSCQDVSHDAAWPDPIDSDIVGCQGECHTSASTRKLVKACCLSMSALHAAYPEKNKYWRQDIPERR